MARYVSFDIETTGLDPAKCDVIEFGAVLEVTGCNTPVGELPSFHAYVTRSQYKGEPYAFSMHSAILKRIAVKEAGFRYVTPHSLGYYFRNWLFDQGFKPNEDDRIEVQAAGKNFSGFDRPFLLRLPDFSCHVQFGHRAFDPGVLFFDVKRDAKIPSTEECLKRAGLPAFVPHTAVEDARNVIRLLRCAWGI